MGRQHVSLMGRDLKVKFTKISHGDTIAAIPLDEIDCSKFSEDAQAEIFETGAGIYFHHDGSMKEIRHPMGRYFPRMEQQSLRL